MTTGNLWALFKGVTNEPAKQFATVTGRNGGQYTVELRSGAINDVLGDGDYDIGSKVFIKSGQIVGQAPDLIYVEIEV